MNHYSALANAPDIVLWNDDRTRWAFNEDYRVTPAPRFVLTWKGPKLKEVYLRHLPTNTEVVFTF